MNSSFEGKVVLITGGTAGIGRQRRSLLPSSAQTSWSPVAEKLRARSRSHSWRRLAGRACLYVWM